MGKNQAEMSDESSVPSEGENYEDMSYGSDVQPPDLATGFVMVHEHCCRARYRPSRAAKDTPFLICLNKSECRSLAGGLHPLLRGCQRAEPGVYHGVYGPSGKLTAARDGTRSSPDALSKLATEARNLNRAHAATIGGLLSDASETEPGFASEARALEGPQTTNEAAPPPMTCLLSRSLKLRSF